MVDDKQVQILNELKQLNQKADRIEQGQEEIRKDIKGNHHETMGALNGLSGWHFELNQKVENLEKRIQVLETKK